MILDMFQAFEAGDVLKLGVAVWQGSRQVAAANLDPGNPENFRIKIAGLHGKSRLGESRGEGSLSRRHNIEHVYAPAATGQEFGPRYCVSRDAR